MRLRFQKYVTAGCLLIAVVLATIGFWWFCFRSEAVAFLPARATAQWIVYPKPLDGVVRPAGPLAAVFRRNLNLDNVPAKALLTVSAFKIGTVLINGHSAPISLGKNWKSPARADVAGLLHSGTNELTVWVTNSMGPPALWLQIETKEGFLTTDKSWWVSLAGAPWDAPRLATESSEIQPSSLLYGTENMLASLSLTGPALTATSLTVLILVMTAAYLFRSQIPHALIGKTTPDQRINIVLVAVLVARAALFIHNQPLLPRTMGFDAKAHEDYVAFILEKHSLPLAADGWEMHQPPLYYAIGAFLLDAVGHSRADEEATLALRAINGVAGLIACWLVLKCLRLLFPRQREAQAAGLLFAAFLPPHLLLSQYVTNEPLAWLLVTLTLFLCLRVLQNDRLNLWSCFGIGATLGGALLTKITALPLLPVLLVALMMHQASQRNAVTRDSLLRVVTVVLSCGVASGWYYWRTLKLSGMAVLPNWEKDSAAAWWQDPGFHTLADCSRFGRALTNPLFSGLNSVWDGLYTTLWGDGLASGTARLAFRPPWNYDLMNAAYLLALVLSLVAGIGLAVTITRFATKPSPQGLLMFGPVVLLLLAVLYIILHSPWIGAIKAFYILPALLPLCALFVVGWNGVSCALPRIRFGLWTVLIVWVISVYSTFWIRQDSPQTHLIRGIFQMDSHKDGEAIESLSLALQMNEDAKKSSRKTLPEVIEADANFSLGLILDRQGKSAEAVQRYRQALQVKGDFVGAANNLAWILASSPNGELRNGTEAVKLAELACDLTKYQTPIFMGTLAAAYAEAGRFSEAVTMAKRARDRASEERQNDVAKRNDDLMRLYQSGKPFREN